MIGLFCYLAITVNPIPLDVVPNSDKDYSLINSVEFHPKKNLLCVTYTHNQKLAFYLIQDKKLKLCQKMTNPGSQLAHPQHAIFSPDGKRLIVANWSGESFNTYLEASYHFFRPSPKSVTPFAPPLAGFKPHGITISPCGQYLAVAHHSPDPSYRAIALYQIVENSLKFIEFVTNQEIKEGDPKGITFTPDGSCLAVSFCDTNILAIYPFENGRINSISKQLFHSEGLKRPEDLKFTRDGHYCAVSNSEHHNVSFHRFDKEANLFHEEPSCFRLQGNLVFPHGLAFSPDGQFLVITQFGCESFEAPTWWNSMKPSQAVVALYEIK